MKRILVLLPCAALCGCTSSGNFAKTFKALGEDPAIVSAVLGTPWGVQRFVRIGGTTNSVMVSPDGTVTVNAHPATPSE